AYGRVKQYDDAIAAIRKAQMLTPEDPEPYVSLAKIYLELQSFRRCEAQIQAALALDHDHPGAHLILSDLKRAQEDFGAAVEVLEGLYERGIEDALMRRAVGDGLKRARLDAARYAALKTAIERTPAAPQDLVGLARFMSAQGAHRRAADLLLQEARLVETAGASAAQPAAVPIGPTPSGEPLASPLSAPQARFEAGVELLAARVYPQAVDLFEDLAGTPPAETGEARPAQPAPELRAAALFNLGVARAALRLDEQAIQAFTTYIAGSPADARAYLYLGNACLRLGRKEEARVAYGSFLERAAPRPRSPRRRPRTPCRSRPRSARGRASRSGSPIRRTTTSASGVRRSTPRSPRPTPPWSRKSSSSSMTGWCSSTPSGPTSASLISAPTRTRGSSVPWPT